MRGSIAFLILALAVGIVLPYFLQDRLVGMGITLPTLTGSAGSVPEHQISGTVIMGCLRAIGVCFAMVAIFYFILSR